MFTPARFIVDESYARRTCGMERTLLAQLRAAAAVDRQSLEMCCWKLQAQIKSRTGREVVVMVAPPIGKPLCVAGDGVETPNIAVWLLLDPLDIDSKQTTFVAVASEVEAEAHFAALYKLAPSFTSWRDEPRAVDDAGDATPGATPSPSTGGGLCDLSDDALFTLAFVIGEDRLPATRHLRMLRWDTPVVGAAANLCALSSTCKQLRELLLPQLMGLRTQLLAMLRQQRGGGEKAKADLSDETLLLWRSALLAQSERVQQPTWRVESHRRPEDTYKSRRACSNSLSAAAMRRAASETEREIARMQLQMDTGPKCKPMPKTSRPLVGYLTTPRVLRHATPL